MLLRSCLLSRGVASFGRCISDRAKLGAAAAAAGTVAVCIGAAPLHAQSPPSSSSSPAPRPLLEQIQQPPPYTADGERFDQRDFGGRCLHFLNTLADLTTLVLPASECKRCQDVLARHAAEPDAPGRPSDAELWQARKVVEAMSHPDTGEVIFAPFRFTAYAPVNLSIAIGMVSAASGSLAASAFWQWFNQSYNVCINQSNRPGGGGGFDSIDSAMLTSYAAATGSAMTLGLGLQALAARTPKGGTIARLVPVTVPFISVAVGGVVNLLCTRNNELNEGILVETLEGEPMGRSVAAAKIALLECSVARVLWAGAILTVAPACAKPIARMVPQKLKLVVELGFTFVVILLAIPMCLAIYPQRETVDPALLEPQFAAHPKTGAPLKLVTFSKGL